jgi:hypothetical protein
MANLLCAKTLQGYSLRATRLDECGNPDFGECGFAVSNGYVQVTLTPSIEEGTRFLQYRPDGTAIINQRSTPVLNWYDVSIQFQEVDPELYNIITNNPLYLDYQTPAQTAGFVVTQDDFATGDFALELWMGNAEEECAPGEPLPYYGYNLLPWVVEGHIAEDTVITNDLITFTLMGRTRSGTPWGTGPYDVMLDELGVPAPLPTPIPTSTHHLHVWSQLAPPDPECGCQDLTS